MKIRRQKVLEKRLYITFKQQLVWIVSTAFAIAAALMWKDVFAQIINIYMPGQTLTSSIYASIVFTLLAVFVIWIVHTIFKE